jgi:hypothetical protein
VRELSYLYPMSVEMVVDILQMSLAGDQKQQAFHILKVRPKGHEEALVGSYITLFSIVLCHSRNSLICEKPGWMLSHSS